MVDKKYGFMKIYGISFFQDTVKELKEGDFLKFVVEFDNKFDSEAVKIETMDNKTVGYVSRKFNKKIKGFLLKGKKYKITIANIYPVPKTSIKGMNIKIEDVLEEKTPKCVTCGKPLVKESEYVWKHVCGCTDIKLGILGKKDE